MPGWDPPASTTTLPAEAPAAGRPAAPLEAEDDLGGQLRLASQVQRDLLPEPPPSVEGIEFFALYRPAGFVSGDIYDIARVDETHVAVSLADATGHGIPAALLTVLIKHYFRGKEVTETGYRILPPEEVLCRLNQDLIETQLSQCQFVTGLHSVYETKTRRIVWARGGAPYPILIRPGQFARQIRSAGGLIGAFEQQHYEPVSLTLEPGDVLLFYTDGLEALLQAGERDPARMDITATSWFARLAHAPIEEQIRQVAERIDATPRRAWRRDDVTLVALRATPT